MTDKKLVIQTTISSIHGKVSEKQTDSRGEIIYFPSLISEERS